MFNRLRLRRDQQGAAAVEFALVAPILFMLLFGIIAFGIVFAQNLALGNAARQAARFGVVAQRTCQDIEDEARDAATTISMSGGDVDVSVKRGQTAGSAANACGGAGTVQPCAGSTVGDSIYVEVGYTSKLIIPLAVVDNSFDLAGEGVFRCEFS